MRFMPISSSWGHVRHGLGHGHLDFRQSGGIGTRQRQVSIEHMVLAHIGVRQNVVAQFLAVPQSGAMAQHDPGMRAQHGDMVGDRLGVGGPDADVDHGDAAPAAAR
jgi:hypothetical protein